MIHTTVQADHRTKRAEEEIVLGMHEPETAFLLKRLKRHDAAAYRQSVTTARIALQLAQAMNYSDEEQAVLCRSALLQDVGKLHVSRETLTSRGRLYQGEVWDLQEHPKISAAILESFIRDRKVDEEAILHHHENLDGTGFPFGVSWKTLSLNARILRVAGQFAELIDSKPVGRQTVKEALEELYCWSDVLYDADLVELLSRSYDDGKSTGGHMKKGDGNRGQDAVK